MLSAMRPSMNLWKSARGHLTDLLELAISCKANARCRFRTYPPIRSKFVGNQNQPARNLWKRVNMGNEAWGESSPPKLTPGARDVNSRIMLTELSNGLLDTQPLV